MSTVAKMSSFLNMIYNFLVVNGSETDVISSLEKEMQNIIFNYRLQRRLDRITYFSNLKV